RCGYIYRYVRHNRFGFYPFEIALFPHIYQTDDQYTYEQAHFKQGKPAPSHISRNQLRLAEDGSPREDEEQFDIEQQEYQGDDIKPRIELYPGVGHGFFATFVRSQFFRGGFFG